MKEILPKREQVPDYYYVSQESKAIIETLTDASLAAKEALEDVLDQFFVNTATWSLKFWEEQVGLHTDRTMNAAARRAAIQKQLIACGNTTEKMVQELAESITGYPARVAVHGDYSFSLELLGEETGFADVDVAEIYSIVDQVKPAHLRFLLSGSTWADAEGVALTWKWFEDSPTTWEKFENMCCIHKK